MLIGGMAVIARGVRRVTEDVDVTIWGDGVETASLLSHLGRHGFTGRIDGAAEFAREHQVLLLRHEATGTPVDLSLSWLPFEREALQRAERLDLQGAELPVATPEDLVIYKVVAWRDVDRADVERLLVRHGGSIDLARVEALVAEFARVLEEPGRVEEFAQLVARTRKHRRR
jgi:hypothetical protein